MLTIIIVFLEGEVDGGMCRRRAKSTRGGGDPGTHFLCGAFAESVKD